MSAESKSARAFVPRPGTADSSAARTYDQNNAGSLSRSSSESHATAAPSSATVPSHSVMSVVLPKPAGAETRINFASAAPARRACNRGRATRLRRGDGMWSFVSTSGFA